MKILTMASNAVPGFMGGELRVALDLSKGYVSRGHECDVLTYGKRTEAMPSTWKLEGLKVRKVETPMDHADRLYLSTRTMFLTKSQSGRLAKEFKGYDVVHVHNIHSISLARDIAKARKASDAKVVWTVHDYWFCCPKMTLMDDRNEVCDDYACFDRCYSGVSGLKRRSIARKSGATVMGETDAIIAPSMYMAGRLAGFGFPKEKIRTIYNGIPNAPFDSDARRSASDILFLGSPMPHKGIGTLLDAVRLLKGRGMEVNLHILGDASSYPEVAKGITANGLAGAVHIHGYVDDAEKAKWLAISAALVLPSAWPENCSIVLLEGLRAGIPIVTSSMGGNPELVKDGENGRTTMSKNAGKLAEAIASIVSDAGLRSTISQRNRERYEERFTSDRMVREYLALIECP